MNKNMQIFNEIILLRILCTLCRGMRRARLAISAAFLAWGGSQSTFVARIIFSELVGADAVALNVFRVLGVLGFWLWLFEP